MAAATDSPWVAIVARPRSSLTALVGYLDSLFVYLFVHGIKYVKVSLETHSIDQNSTSSDPYRTRSVS